LVGLHKYNHHKHQQQEQPQQKYSKPSQTMTTKLPSPLEDDNSPKFEIDFSVLKPNTDDAMYVSCIMNE
jgi:hypothetical protein